MADDSSDETGTAAAKTAKTAKGGPVRNLQDTFLVHLKETQTPVTVFLVSGVKLQGRVTDFDGFTVALTRDGATQLVYKRVISTIAPLGPIDLYGGEREEGEVRRPRPPLRGDGPPRGPRPDGPPRGPRRPPPTRPIVERRKLT
jgi:host factor-I protein